MWWARRPGVEAVSQALALQPDVVVMDLDLPELDGIGATRQIVATSPHVGVLVLTMFDDDDSFFAAMRAGARGYLLKGADQEDIRRAIRLVGDGEAILGPGVARRLVEYFSAPRLEAPREAFPELTERERQVLNLIAEGHANPAIATRTRDQHQDRSKPRVKHLHQAPGRRPRTRDHPRPRGRTWHSKERATASRTPTAIATRRPAPCRSPFDGSPPFDDSTENRIGSTSPSHFREVHQQMMRWIVGSSLKARGCRAGRGRGGDGLWRRRSCVTPRSTCFPSSQPPTVEVQTEALGLSAEEVEQLITVPLEQDLLAGVAWLDKIRSASVPGLSSIEIIFEPGTDLYRARQVVQERLSQAAGLPNVSTPPQMLQPLSSTSRTVDGRRSRPRSCPRSRSACSRTGRSGPASWACRASPTWPMWGQRERQLQVQVDPQKLEIEHVTLDQVIARPATRSGCRR